MTKADGQFAKPSSVVFLFFFNNIQNQSELEERKKHKMSPAFAKNRDRFEVPSKTPSTETTSGIQSTKLAGSSIRQVIENTMGR